MTGVGVEGDVGKDSDLGNRILDRPDRAADEVVGIDRLARIFGAQVIGRIGKKRDARNPEIARLAGPGSEPVDRPARHAGKRRDRLLAVFPVGDEQWPDEIAGMEPMLGQHRADPG